MVTAPASGLERGADQSSGRRQAESGVGLLVRERAAAVAEAARLRNQLHALLLQLDPQYKDHLPALTSPEGISALVAPVLPHVTHPSPQTRRRRRKPGVLRQRDGQ